LGGYWQAWSGQVLEQYDIAMRMFISWARGDRGLIGAMFK
jgi:hypothetical protein